MNTSPVVRDGVLSKGLEADVPRVVQQRGLGRPAGREQLDAEHPDRIKQLAAAADLIVRKAAVVANAPAERCHAGYLLRGTHMQHRDRDRRLLGGVGTAARWC